MNHTMKHWALIEGNIVSTITEQENKPEIDGIWVECPYEYGPGCKYIGGEFFPPDPPPVIRTRLEIINLLDSDYVSIITASKTDVAVEVWLEKFRLTEIFDMSSSVAQSEIEFLVTKNLINQEKADLILGK
jgi:hypothetical protein